MKNRTFKLAMIMAVVGSFFISCDEDKTTAETLDFPGDAFVAFEKSGESAAEASGAVTITAQYGSTVSEGDLTFGFNITSATAVEGVDYEVVDNRTTFDFPSGVHTNSITINLIDNLLTGEDKELLISLSGNGNVNAGFAGPDALNSTFKLTILDDDCPFTVQELGDASWAGMDNVPAAQSGPNSSQIATSSNGTDLIFEGIGYAWITDADYWEEVVVTSNLVTATVDAVGNITIAEQPLCTTTWLGDIQDDYFVSATGSYAACSQTMTINYDIIQGGAVLRSFTDVITIN